MARRRCEEPDVFHDVDGRPLDVDVVELGVWAEALWAGRPQAREVTSGPSSMRPRPAHMDKDSS